MTGDDWTRAVASSAAGSITVLLSHQLAWGIAAVVVTACGLVVFEEIEAG